jgi:hypothetical protein
MAEESYELANIINIQDVFGLNSTEINGVETPIYPMIFINTQAEDRVRRWLGALNDNHFIGCGLNVLAFTGIMSRGEAEHELTQIDRVNGLSIGAVVDKFNIIFHEKGMNVIVGSQSTPIATREQLEERFAYFDSILLPDSYLIVRFGRHVDPNQRLRNVQPDPQLYFNPEYARRYHGNFPMSDGHYVLVVKATTGELVTIDPHRSISHEYTGSVSDNFWDLWHNVNGYVSIDILKCYETHLERSGGGIKNGVYIVPNKVIKQFIKEILESYKCNNSRKSYKKKKSKRTKPVQGTKKVIKLKTGKPLLINTN